MRIIYTVCVLIIVILAIIFAIKNAADITVYYYTGQVTMPLSLALGLALVFGTILGVLVSLKTLLSAKYALRSLKHELSLAKKEISNLRAIPLKD